MKFARTLCSTILMSCAALCWTNSLAGEPVTRQRVVNYADLNLNNHAGVKALYRRIRGAARSVCSASEISLVQRQAKHECVQNAIDGAIGDVDNTNLTAYHQEKTGGRLDQKMAGRR